MGTYKSKGIRVDNEKLERIPPEPDYEIKTRSPVIGSWRDNVSRGIRENELKDQAMVLARRKCVDPVVDYKQCTQREGMFWMVFNCQQDFHYVSQCFEHQFDVQMDKRRRDIVRNHEPWWTNIYSADGEVGEQAKMPWTPKPDGSGWL